MAVPRTTLHRNSPLWVGTVTAKNTPRLLALIAVNCLYSQEGTDPAVIYRKHRANATLFFDSCVRGDIQPCRNAAQAELARLLPASQVAHLYFGCWGHDDVTHYVSLVRGVDGLFRLRHPKIRVAPKHLARDGVFASWGKITPRPDLACGLPIVWDRVLTGGRATHDFIAEATNVYEVRRQLTHCAMLCELFGCLHRDELVTWHEPGRAALRVNNQMKNGWINPYEFFGVDVRPYAQPGTQKMRVTVFACASDAGLYAAQSPRCVMASVKGLVEYQPQSRMEGWLLSEILLSRLLPFVGAVGANGKVSLLGLHYDVGHQKGIIGEFISGRLLRHCEGIPMVKPVNRQGKQFWLPNAALLTVLQGLIYDPTPDNAARLERWHALTRVFRAFGVSDPAEMPNYFIHCGLPLPADATDHIADLIAAEKAHYNHLKGT